MAEAMSPTATIFSRVPMPMAMPLQALVQTGPAVAKDPLWWVITIGPVVATLLLPGTQHMGHEVAVLPTCRAQEVMGSFTALPNSIYLHPKNEG